MTYEEAIREIQEEGMTLKSMELAIEALEKQMKIKERINEVIAELDKLSKTASADYKSTSDIFFFGGAAAFGMAKITVKAKLGELE